MGGKVSEEFKRDAVRLEADPWFAAAPGCVGFGHWAIDLPLLRDGLRTSRLDRELALENERLRRENRLLREEREVLKKNCSGLLSACAR